MKTTNATAHAARRPAPPSPLDLSALLGEYAGLAQHPGEDSERLALAIRVIETLQRDAHAGRPEGLAQ